MATNKKPIILPPIHPNAGIRANYQSKLEKLLTEINNSVMYWLTAAYKANQPEISMAHDASPTIELQKSLNKLTRRWKKKFNQKSIELSKFFVTAAKDRSDAKLKELLGKSGFAVEFKMTKVVNDIVQASVAENVGLIKSIAEQHLSKVEGLVMRSVQVGRDIGGLTKDLQKQFGISKRRAALIAKDQNNKTTATITRARQLEVGITEAIWMHSLGGRKPRPEHVAANGKRYDVVKGMYLEGVWTWPGREVNCRCVCRPIIPALD